MQIAIVGASLAGAFLANELGGSGHEVFIFDPRAPWEKPCGGGLYAAMLRKYPVLAQVCKWNFPSRLRLVSSGGERVFPTQGQWAIASRAELNRGLLEPALRHSNMLFVRDRVTELARLGPGWRVETAGGASLAVDLVVGADGVNSLVRRTVGARLPRDQRGLAVGYLVSGGPADEVLIKTYPELIGYAWYFPRAREASLGIGTLAAKADVPGLWRRLRTLIDERYPGVKQTSRWGAALPAVSAPARWAEPCAGANWVLVGDAAGHVNALLGEGMPYALTDAHLAADAIRRGRLAGYDRAWRNEYGPWLRRSGDAVQILRADGGAGYDRALALALGGSNLLAKWYARAAAALGPPMQPPSLDHRNLTGTRLG